MNAFPPLPENWKDQRPHIGRINELGANNLTADILAAEPHISFHFVVFRLLKRLLEENHVLAFEDVPVPRLAWATRNIMELRVLARYVCQSEENIKRFQADFFTIATTTLRTMINLHNDLAKELGGPARPRFF